MVIEVVVVRSAPAAVAFTDVTTLSPAGSDTMTVSTMPVPPFVTVKSPLAWVRVYVASCKPTLGDAPVFDNAATISVLLQCIVFVFQRRSLISRWQAFTKSLPRTLQGEGELLGVETRHGLGRHGALLVLNGKLRTERKPLLKRSTWPTVSWSSIWTWVLSCDASSDQMPLDMVFLLLPYAQEKKIGRLRQSEYLTEKTRESVVRMLCFSAKRKSVLSLAELARATTLTSCTREKLRWPLGCGSEGCLAKL